MAKSSYLKNGTAIAGKKKGFAYVKDGVHGRGKKFTVRGDSPAMKTLTHREKRTRT